MNNIFELLLIHDRFFKINLPILGNMTKNTNFTYFVSSYRKFYIFILSTLFGGIIVYILGPPPSPPLTPTIPLNPGLETLITRWANFG